LKTYIYASALNPGTLINKVGKYLKNNIDGAFKIKFGPMLCEIEMRMYYQIPNDPESFDEIHFLIDITSYANKLRINITENTKMEKTIGQLILTSDELQDLVLIRKKILKKIEDFISKEYADYDFIF